jgi:hypothetical protein
MKATDWISKLREFAESEPLMALALGSAMFAMATTPIAFAILGHTKWFHARRGRVLREPEFWSVVCSMLLVMGIPAIFIALAIKSRTFDKDRYEFDPNKTWSVLEQGRSYKTLEQADKAVKEEMTRLAEERKNLSDSVKKLDQAMLSLRAVAGTSPQVAKAVPDVLQRLATLRKSVGVDAPQQLMDFTAPPVELANASAPGATASPAPAVATAPPPSPAPAVAGLSKEIVEAEIGRVPPPQRTIAGMLPLVDIPAGWTVGKSGEGYVETFNADNLFEKIDGRAESFLQYNVKGMAYTYYHPTGDESNEVQVYIFEMADSLKALGKFGSEKPEEAKPVAVGSEGYTSAGSTLFYVGPYYTQIISTKDDTAFSTFVLDLAKRIAEKQKGSGKSAAVASGDAPATPETLFALLPSGPGKSGPKYVTTDVFGYSFLSDVFMAEYSEGKVTWQGFLRPYATADEAKAVFDKYIAGAKQDGAEIKEIQAEGADRMVIASNIGLVDAFFFKGNCVGGANGATDAKIAETFGRAFAKSLPAKVPMIISEKKEKSDADPEAEVK